MVVGATTPTRTALEQHDVEFEAADFHEEDADHRFRRAPGGGGGPCGARHTDLRGAGARPRPPDVVPPARGRRPLQPTLPPDGDPPPHAAAASSSHGPRPPPPLPVLLAPVPFRNATARTCEVRPMGSSVRFMDSLESPSHDLEVHGLLLPSAVHSLLTALADTQPLGYHVKVMGTHPATAHFAALTGPQWDPQVVRPDLATSSTSSAPRFRLPRPLTRLDHHDGTYTTTLS
eukprot:TRINITY_DN16117_c0_g1_i1.p2 TRINITY_DN16117_c0_g1~~TRINITY_DN16117_c0_g1_i1.p2  ORF type:complete len:232 (+),score=48.76 TRINITY_DN16117_c0_g1_i1:307-1002(+)